MIFLFLFITYVLSVIGNLTIITLTGVDSHLQTPMYFFLRNLSFLEIFTTVCIPRFPGAIITKDKTISYNNCATQLFFFIFKGDWILYSNCRVLWPLCCYLQAPALHNHHEQDTLQPACGLRMAQWVSNYFPTHYASPAAGLVSFQCHWSLFVWLSPPFTIIFFRYMVPRNNWFILCFGYLAIHFGFSDFVIYMHYQDYSENPICQSDKKGLL